MENLNEQVNKIIDQYIDLLPTESNGVQVQSEVKASKFLIAIAKLAAIRDQLLNAKVKKESLHSVTFNEVLSIQKGGDAKGREVAAKANPDYISINEQVEMIENKLVYVKTMQDIFLNAHLLYRSMMKGEM